MSYRRVKIVATVGPSLATKESLIEATKKGMNVVRLNFSHGTHEDHLKTINWIKEIRAEYKVPLALLQDLQGPKIRVTKFKDGPIELVEGQEVVLSPKFEVGERGKIGVDLESLPSVVKEGSKIRIDDGLIDLRVLRVEGDMVYCIVIEGGQVKERKGVNIPGAQLPIACLTAKDLNDLEFGLKHGVDYVALSFVRKRSDIEELRDIIDANSTDIRIIAKIEMLEALDNLDSIIEVSDAVMVARGDLAVEVGQERLPGIQKEIIKLSNSLGKPVITATQMLDSMVTRTTPTRAEVTDVANAVLDGSDALMLSAETASGRHPDKCIETMSNIISEVEKSAAYYMDKDIRGSFSGIADAVSASACLSARKLAATAIVCLSTSGRTAIRISAYRPAANIIAVTDSQSEQALNRLSLAWGIRTMQIDPYESSDEAFAQIEDRLLRYGLAKPGDQVIMTLGLPVASKAKTNSMRINIVSERETSAIPKEGLPLRYR